MPLDDLMLRRVVRQTRSLPREILSGTRADKVQRLRAAVAQGRVTRAPLLTLSGVPRFIYGITGMNAGVIVGADLTTPVQAPPRGLFVRPPALRPYRPPAVLAGNRFRRLVR